MKGVIPQNTKCTHCQNYVNEADAIWDEGKPYHESCYPRYLSGKIAALDKKTRYGNLTMADAKELSDLKELHAKMRNLPADPPLQRQFYPDVAIFHGNTPLGLYGATKSKNTYLSTGTVKI